MSTTSLSGDQVLQEVYDPATHALKTDIVANISGAQEVIISDLNDSIAIGNGAGVLAQVNGSRELLVKDTTADTSLSSIDTKTPTLGQKTMANSSPVVIASDQSAIPISGTITGTISGNVTVVQPTGSNLHVVVDSGTIAATQSGTWNINNISGTVSLPTGASTSALQTTGNTSLSSIDSHIPAGLTVTSTRLLVDGSGVTQPVSGSVSVSNFPATQPVSGTVTANQGGTWTVQPGNTANTTAWKVDGSAVTQPVSGTFFQATQPISAAALPLPSGASTSALQTTGNTSLSSIDSHIPSGLTVTSTRLLVDGSGVTQPVSGTVTATISGTVAATQSGTWTVQPGNTANTTAWKVDGSAVTQPISAAALPLPSGASTSALQTTGNTSLSSIDSHIPSGLTVTATRLLVDGSGVTQPVSGTVTAAQATAANLNATVVQSSGANLHVNVDSMPTTTVTGTVAATQSGTWNINNVSGTVSLPTGASTSSLQTTGNTSLSSIDSHIPSGLTVTSTRLLVDGSGVTQPVSGTVTANQGGTWTVQPGNTANTTAWKVDGSAVTQPISGTVTVNPLTNSSVVKAQVQDNAGNAINSTSNALNVSVQNSTIAVTQSGNFTIQPLTNSSIVKAQLQDNSGTAITLGQKASAASVPVVIANDQSAISVAPTPNTYSNTGSGTAIGDFPTPAINLSAYTNISIQVSGSFIGTLIFEGSNDNVNFFPVLATPISAVMPASSTISSTGIWITNLGFSVFRTRVTSIVAGTITVSVLAQSISEAPIDHNTTLYTANPQGQGSQGIAMENNGNLAAILDVNTQMLMELRSMRLALVSLATEGKLNNSRDYDPYSTLDTNLIN